MHVRKSVQLGCQHSVIISLVCRSCPVLKAFAINAIASYLLRKGRDVFSRSPSLHFTHTATAHGPFVLSSFYDRFHALGKGFCPLMMESINQLTLTESNTAAQKVNLGQYFLLIGCLSGFSN